MATCIAVSTDTLREILGAPPQDWVVTEPVQRNDPVTQAVVQPVTAAQMYSPVPRTRVLLASSWAFTWQRTWLVC